MIAEKEKCVTSRICGWQGYIQVFLMGGISRTTRKAEVLQFSPRLSILATNFPCPMAINPRQSIFIRSILFFCFIYHIMQEHEDRFNIFLGCGLAVTSHNCYMCCELSKGKRKSIKFHLPGAPNDGFLPNAIKICFRLSGVHLKLCIYFLSSAIKFISVRPS